MTRVMQIATLLLVGLFLAAAFGIGDGGPWGDPGTMPVVEDATR